MLLFPTKEHRFARVLFLFLLVAGVVGQVFGLENHKDNTSTSALASADETANETTLQLTTRRLESEDTLPPAIAKRARINCSNFTKQKKCKRAGNGGSCEWRTRQDICVTRNGNGNNYDSTEAIPANSPARQPTLKPTFRSGQTNQQDLLFSKTFEQSKAFEESTYGPASRAVGQMCDAIDIIFDGDNCDKTVTVFFRKINLCQLAADLGIPTEIVKTAVNSCPCLEKAVDYLEQGHLEYILNPFDTSDSSETEFIHQAEGLIECFTDVVKDLPSHSPATEALISYKTNREEVIESLKREGEILVHGKEIGTEFTSKLADDFLLCPPANRFECILDTLTLFSDHSGEAICDSLGESLLSYLDYLFESQTISSLVDDLVDSISVCMGPSESSQLAIALTDLMNSTNTLLKTMHPAINAACKSSFDVFPVVTDVLKKVEEGDLNVFHAVEIIINSVQASNVVDIVGEEIKSILPQLEAELFTMIKDAEAIVNLAMSSTSNKECLANLPNVMVSIVDATQTFITQMKTGDFDVIVGTEPLDSSIEIHTDDLPCTRIVTRKFFGFVKVPVPEFYDCDARFDLSIPLPPEFVPYFRLKLIID